MSARNRSTFSQDYLKQSSSSLRGGHRRVEDVSALDFATDDSTENARLRAEVEYLRRRDKERKVENEKLLSKIKGMQQEQAVLAKEVEVERGRTKAAELRHELLKVEVSNLDSVGELAELREKRARGMPM